MPRSAMAWMRQARVRVMLAFYVERRGLAHLTQQHLAAAPGISLLLRRQRPFTAAHARKLGASFKVNSGLFL